MRIRVALVVLVGLALAATGCSNVPGSSRPQVIKSMGPAAQPPLPLITPPAGVDPATIVSQFLSLNVDTRDDKHQAAKQFLTPQAQTRWSDKTATVVSGYSVSPMDAKTRTVTVNVVKVGQLAANGIYTSVVQDQGTGAETVPLSYAMTKVNGQWRIEQPAPGLVVRESDMSSSLATAYQLRALYFFDLSGKHLVADPRYSPLTGQALANWLLAQFIAGPRQELANAVLPLPDQVNGRAVSVVVSGALTSVEIPGASALDHDSLRRLAAQLANTFAVEISDSITQITDGGHPVAVPGVGAAFTVSDFAPAQGSLSGPPVWFLNGQGVIVDGDTGLAVEGPLGEQPIGLTSIAVGRNGSSEDYRVAGTVGPADGARLLVGTFATGLRDSGLPPGPLGRPAWLSEAGEVWVGDGPYLIRVPSDEPPVTVPLTMPVGEVTAIKAVRFSADGVRVALVLAAGGSSMCYVGVIERGGSSVRVDNLVPVTPASVTVTDVDWNDVTTLYVAGDGPGAFSVWQVQSDGSAWTDRQAGGLPATPDSITVAWQAPAWVSADGWVYTQSRASWQSPPFQPENIQVRGASPAYLK
ncbi:MAG: LpqB family beta-propeller domain-containing protein [Actinomycetia bacterium]|nr:LpqB family beta-propeller domain-containing protein [Actinomycetes bacterium]